MSLLILRAMSFLYCWKSPVVVTLHGRLTIRDVISCLLQAFIGLDAVLGDAVAAHGILESGVFILLTYNRPRSCIQGCRALLRQKVLHSSPC